MTPADGEHTDGAEVRRPPSDDQDPVGVVVYHSVLSEPVANVKPLDNEATEANMVCDVGFGVGGMSLSFIIAQQSPTESSVSRA